MVGYAPRRALPDPRIGRRYQWALFICGDRLGDGTPLHMHENEDKHLMVLEGVARVAVGDRVFDAEAGSPVMLPKNVPHACGNRSAAPLRIAVIAYPGGVEEALRAIAHDKAVDLLALARSFSVIPIGPTPF